MDLKEAYHNEIKVGDKILVRWIWPDAEEYGVRKAWLTARPQGPGDLWEVEYENGTRELLNPYHWGFSGFERCDWEEGA